MTDKQASRQLTHDEWVVLLDVYLTHRNGGLSPKHPAVIEASDVLQALGRREGHSVGPPFVHLLV